MMKPEPIKNFEEFCKMTAPVSPELDAHLKEMVDMVYAQRRICDHEYSLEWSAFKPLRQCPKCGHVEGDPLS